MMYELDKKKRQAEKFTAMDSPSDDHRKQELVPFPKTPRPDMPA